MTSSPAPAVRLTVDQLIEQLEMQRAYGRGGYQVVVYPTGGRQQIEAVAGHVSGLPEEMGERVGFYVVPGRA
jgi:hypothetical protein